MVHLILLLTFQQEDEEWHVTVRHACIKKEPRQFSDNLRPLYYGQKIKYISVDEYWIRARTEVDGFIHGTALRKRLPIATTVEWDERVELEMRRKLPDEYNMIEDQIEKSYEQKYTRHDLERRVSVFKANGRLK